MGFDRSLPGNVDVVLFQSKIVERFKNIECGDIVTRVDEEVRKVTTNEACSAGDEDVHSEMWERTRE